MKAAICVCFCLAFVAPGCGSDDPRSADDTGTATTAATTARPPGSVGESAIVGRWERVVTCSELLSALEAAGLRKLAPKLVGENYFPNTPAADLAKKDDLCEGAKRPFVHSHFFNAAGRFGSLDENENFVGGTNYAIIDRRTIRIGGERGNTFRYTIKDDRLMLSPVLTEAMVKEALANPLTVTNAGMAIAVAYPGHVWKRVSCKSWC